MQGTSSHDKLGARRRRDAFALVALQDVGHVLLRHDRVRNDRDPIAAVVGMLKTGLRTLLDFLV